MNAGEILADVRRCGVELFVLDGRLKASSPGVLPAELKAVIREHAAEIRAALPIYVRAEQDRTLADQALDLLNRLKGYTVPSGRMTAARTLAARMRGLTEPAAILGALKNFERELAALGGEYDPQLAEVIDIVQRSFPGARLVK